MKIFFIIFMFISSSCYGQSAEDVALKYVQEFSILNFQVAAEMVYCSKEIDKSKTIEKHIGLAKELKFLITEFGVVKEFKIPIFSASSTVILGCAPISYIKSHPIVKRIFIEVTYENKKKGYINVGFIKEDKILRPLLVEHGIPLNGIISTNRVANVYKKLANLPHNKAH